MILDGRVMPEQLGAYLMLLRIKEESPEELAGFTLAVRAKLPEAGFEVDIDWPCYAGKKRRSLWFLLAAKALASAGFRIHLHGAGAHTAGRQYVEDCLEALDIPLATSMEEAAATFRTHNLVFTPLSAFSPVLQQIIGLRPLMGLRSPVHSLARMINPSQAPLSLQSIFHPGYQPVHQQAACLLGEQEVLILKGDGGEFEVRPDKPGKLLRVQQGQASTQPLGDFMTPVAPDVSTPDVDALVRTWEHGFGQTGDELRVLTTLGLILAQSDKGDHAPIDRARAVWSDRLT
jgi:anthranilate phosphoribosyltransferase